MLRLAAEAEDAEKVRIEQEKQAERKRIIEEKKRKRLNWLKNYWLPSSFIAVISFGVIFLWLFYTRYTKLISVGFSDDELLGQPYWKVEEKLNQIGFTNIKTVESKELTGHQLENENKVSRISIERTEDFDKTDQFPYDARITITYMTLKPIKAPGINEDYKNKNYLTVKNAFE